MLILIQISNFQHKYFKYVFNTKFLIVFRLAEIFVSMQYKIKFQPRMTLKTVTFLCLLFLLKSTLLQGQSSYLGTEIFGKASYYENVFYGRKTANGEILNRNAMSCAHQTLPFGTMIEVTNLTNNNSCIVRVNDRGPFIKKRVLDLTHAAAKRLNMLHKGVVNVKITIVGQNNKVYIASPGSMIKSTADLIVTPSPDKNVKVPLKPRHKTILSKPSKAANNKRAIRRGRPIATPKKKGHKKPV